MANNLMKTSTKEVEILFLKYLYMQSHDYECNSKIIARVILLFLIFRVRKNEENSKQKITSAMFELHELSCDYELIAQ